MKRLILVLLWVPFGPGCTAVSLQRHSLQQIASVADLRYQEVTDNLAVVAANLDTLPSLGIVADGTALVADTASFDAKTLWARSMGMTFFKGFLSETITPGFTRNPQPSWSVEPIVDREKLEGSWQALRWALGHPPEPGSSGDTVLKFLQVEHDLAKLPSGWLCVGCWKDVPHKVAYKGHCGDTWVWVTPDGMSGLSALTLVVLDIGTVDLNSLRKPVDAGKYPSEKVKVVVTRTTDKDNKIEQTLERDKQQAGQFPAECGFGLTATSIESLCASGVPEAVVQKLMDLKDKKFKTQEQFVDNLKTILTQDELKSFQDLVLSRARLYRVHVSLDGFSVPPSHIESRYLEFSTLDMEAPKIIEGEPFKDRSGKPFKDSRDETTELSAPNESRLRSFQPVK